MRLILALKIIVIIYNINIIYIYVYIYIKHYFFAFIKKKLMGSCCTIKNANGIGDSPDSKNTITVDVDSTIKGLETKTSSKQIGFDDVLNKNSLEVGIIEVI
jgi:hypothetical protein